MNAAIDAARRGGLPRRERRWARGQRLRPRGAGRRRRLCLRRGDRAARKPRGQARPWCAPSRRCRRIKGLFGKPTVDQQRALARGRAVHPGARARRPIATSAWAARAARMPIQLAGNIKHGGLFETRVRRHAAASSSTTSAAARAAGRPVRAVQVGGPLGAYFPRALFDTPFDYEAFAARDGLIGHGGIVVFDDTVDMAQQARFAMEFCAVESLRQVHALPHRLDARRRGDRPHRRRRERARRTSPSLEDLCDTMKFGSLCALGGFTPYPVLSALTHFPEDFGARADAPAGRGMRRRDHDARPRDRLRHAARARRRQTVTLTIDGERSRCRRAPRSCAPRWRWARKIPKLCATDILEPSAPAACAWSRSRAAPARRPPAPRRSRDGMVGAHPDRAARNACARA